MINLANKLKQARKDKGLSQGATADLLGINRNTYGDMESGKTSPTLDRLFRLSEITGKDMSWFVGIDKSEREAHLEARLNKVTSQLADVIKLANGGDA